ncbi:MFS transporter [Tichowtungia aerotolerans]|uniref:MFS transporter n=1 Tax=Tichowtungia aerotolerans TaxID=2697043 RepID=A0A6P1M4H9_9BACT|nr:MFS transporter [Tichowtungia aerotolerans]QHI67913.1 MFS transporter [Tichowtungia aerotolerans]
MKFRQMNLGRYDCAVFSSFSTYAAGSVIIPVVLVRLARDLGFSLEDGGMTAGGALQIARTLPMVLALLLSGFAAGRWGKRRVFGWSVLLMGAGVGLCAVSPVYGILFLALAVAGFGEGTIEGLATPLVQDLHPKEPGRYINFSHSFWSIGILITVLLAGALLSAGVSWRILTGAVALFSLIPGFLLLRPSKRGQQVPDHTEPLHWSHVHKQMVDILRIPRFWVFFFAMFFAGGAEFCLTFWSASYIQLHFGSTAWAGGAGTALFAAGMMAGRMGWGWLLHQHHLRRLILGSSVIAIPITLLFPMQAGLVSLFILLFIAGICTAPLWPSIQSFCADRIPHADTTMLFILLSCAGIPGCGVFTFLMGLLGNMGAGLGPAFYLVPFCFAVIALLVGMERKICPRSDCSGHPKE